MAHTAVPTTAYNENGQVVLLDTLEIPDLETVKESFENNDREFPGEDTEEYWDEVNFIKESNLDCFRDNVADLGTLVMRGSCGLWDGNHACGTVADVPNGQALLNVVCNGRGVDDCKIYLDREDGLRACAYHHDGTNCYTFRQLTEKGRKLYEKWENGDLGISERELHEMLWKPAYSRKIHWWLDT